LLERRNDTDNVVRRERVPASTRADLELDRRSALVADDSPEGAAPGVNTQHDVAQAPVGTRSDLHDVAHVDRADRRLINHQSDQRARRQGTRRGRRQGIAADEDQRWMVHGSFRAEADE